MKLVLAEKPSVAQSIAKVLGAAKREDGYLEGNGYVVSWCVGHLVELAQPEVYDAKYSKWAYADLPIFPMDWQYEVSAGTKKQFGILKKLMAREDVASLVCATDAGREGELIFRLVYHKAGCRKPFERLWISSMEDVAIKEGFENLRSGTEYDALYEAALCRERADWIVGINATRLFSTLYGQTLNVGRVMTPTLAMAVMREAAISAFKPELFYTVQIGLDGFTAASERFKTKAAAEAVKHMDKFYQSLLKVKTKVVQNKKPKNEYLTVHTVREIHKFLRSAFNQAVKWELMTRNPVLNATLPKEEHQKREIWTAETLMHALEVCDDDILALAINLSFACSLRMGEMLGLTWDCIDISEESLKENNASIFVDKELQRVNRDVMEVLDNKDIIRVFPRTLSNTNTSLVLKTPKTKTSVRKIFLPSTVAQMLLERKKQIDEMKELFGDEYLDYDLVFCHSSGRPMEGQVINRALKKLIQDNDLPDVVFHSFRHASITYKLKWNGGDMKSVQGDSGHARMDMVADVYSHIIDEDRRYNAQKFEEQFYNAKGLKNAEEGKTAPMPKFETSVELLDPMAEVQKESEVEKEKPAENSTDENAALLTKLLSNPETAALLKALAKTI